MDVQGKNGDQKVMDDFVYTDGRAIHASWAAIYDGKDYPVTGNPDVDTISVTKVNPYTIEHSMRLSRRSGSNQSPLALPILP